MSTMRVTSADIPVLLAVGAALAVPIVIGGAAGSGVPSAGFETDGVDVVRADPLQSGRDGRTRSSAPSTESRISSARRRDAGGARPATAREPVGRSGPRRNRPADAGRSAPTPSTPVSPATVPPQPAPTASPASPPAGAPPPFRPPPAASPPAPPPLIPPLPPILSPPPPPPPALPPPPPPPVGLPPVPPLPPLPPLPPVDVPPLPIP
jgi:hypothetical protein